MVLMLLSVQETSLFIVYWRQAVVDSKFNFSPITKETRPKQSTHNDNDQQSGTD